MASSATQHRNYFPSADIVRLNESTAGLEVCWKEFEEVWKWRRDLLDQGWIELTVGSANPDDGMGPKSNSMPPIQRWLAANDEDRFNDFDALKAGRRTSEGSE